MGWGKKDTAKETGDSVKEVSKAWHQARSDSQEDGRLPERERSKAAEKEK